MKKILTIDGGGVRGMIPATVVRGLEEDLGKPCHEMFDMISGTSVGGILTLALASGISGYDCQKLIQKESPGIFQASTWRRMGFAFNQHTYKGDNLIKPMNKTFEEKWLATDLHAEILVPAYELETKTPRFFSRSRARKRGDSNFRIADVAAATASAPTYFPPHRAVSEAGNHYSYIDGGVFANNPSMSAYVEARNIWPDEKEFMLISLGTGQETIRIPNTESWGLWSWLSKGLLLSIVFDGVSDTTAYHVYNMIPLHHYYRLTKRVDIEMDDAAPETLARLRNVGMEIRATQEYKRVLEVLK